MSEFAGKSAVITGGGRGIGLACARLIAERGGSVVLLGHDQDMVNGAEAELRASGLCATAIVADISVEAEVAAALARAEEVMGAVDILVNNAAIQPYGTVESMGSRQWDSVMGVNLRGTYLACHYTLASYGRARSRFDREYCLGPGLGEPGARRSLCNIKGRHAGADAFDCRRFRSRGHSRKCCLSRLHRRADDALLGR